MEKAELLNALVSIEASLSAGPWSKKALYEAIRHVQRNTDVMEYGLEYQDEGEPRGLPDRYDGEAIAVLRNLLPEIINHISKD